MEYSPLSEENHEIRLLTLVEGKNSAFVSCQLEHCSLVEHPPYTALSYCWGNPDITKTILLNGVKVQATVNLEAALRQLQAEGYTKLWVDALCINQNDREERSRQVLRMRRIYMEARLVLVWLGIATPSSKIAIAFIDLVTRSNDALKYLRDRGGEENDETVKKTRAAMSPIVQKWLDKLLHEGSDKLVDGLMEDMFMFDNEDSRQAFIDFFHRPYWRRVWIIQEIVSGARVVVYCGADSTKLENIERVLARTAEGKEFLRTGQVPNFEAFRKSQFSGEASPLVKLLVSSRASLATDPRDKVYGLLGLASDGEELIPLPNYKQPLGFILEEMTKSILSIRRCPNILLFRAHDREPNERLPSWVPDWTDLSRMNRPWHTSLAGPDGDSAYFGEMVHHLHHLLAPFSRRMTSLTRPPIEFRGRRLEMKGKIIDVVDGLSSQCGDEQSITDKEWLRRKMIQPLEKRTRYPDDQETTWAIVKSLSMDEVYFGHGIGKGDNTHMYVDSFSLLSSKKARQFMERYHPKLLSWLEDNETFLVDGQTLEDWIQKADKFPVPDYSLSVRVLRKYMQRIAQVVECGMRLATTRDGRVGMVHPQTQRGDVICSLLGCSLPVVLRASGSKKKTYHIVGEAYLHPMKSFTTGILAENLDMGEMVDFYIE